MAVGIAPPAVLILILLVGAVALLLSQHAADRSRISGFRRTVTRVAACVPALAAAMAAAAAAA
eukprot:5226060-Pleurochrysis_carterae.AAC.1